MNFRVVENLGQLPRSPWRVERGGRIIDDQLITAQVLVEGTQAGGLAVDGRGRAGGATIAGRQVGKELGDVSRSGRERVEVVGTEILTKLQQVAAIGVEGVAREASL